MKRYAILTSSNQFPRLGANSSLMGCDNDTSYSIHTLLNNQNIFPGLFDKVWALTGPLDNAEHVRDILALAISALKSGDQLIGPFNSSHGTHFLDWQTNQQMSCTCCYNSDWNDPKTFVSKLDYRRAFAKLKRGVRVWTRFDSCESGNMGEAFKLVDLVTSTRANRWISPPLELHAEIRAAPVSAPIAMPQQVCTMAGCTEKGTCADIHDQRPHGLFSQTFDDKAILAASKMTKYTQTWRQLATANNTEWAKTSEEQRCVVNGPDFPLGSEA